MNKLQYLIELESVISFYKIVIVFSKQFLPKVLGPLQDCGERGDI